MKATQVPSEAEQRWDWWRWLVCIQAAFHAGDKILLELLSPRQDQPTPALTCAPEWKCALPFLLHVCLSLLYLALFPSLSSHTLLAPFHFSHPAPFCLILSGPLHYSSLSLPQEEPQSYLGYVGFCELKSHCTNSLSASPENKAGYLKQFHHSPGFVCRNDAQWET